MKDNIRTNVIVNLVRTLALTVLSFLTFPWACRVLGDAQMGLYAWCNTFAYYFLIIAKVGIPNLAVRECVKVRDNKELLSNRAQLFFIIQGIFTIASFGLMCSLVFSVPQLFSAKEIIFLLAINFVSGAFSFEWIFIALEKQFYMSIRSIVILAITTLLIISLVRNPDDIYMYALITAGVTVLTSIANLIYVTSFISFKKTMPYEIKPYIKPLFTLFMLTLMLAIYDRTDTFILGFINPSKEQVGAYSVGVKGIEIIIGVITALSTVFIPRAAFYYEKEDKRFFNNLNRYSVNIAMFIVLPAIVTMSMMSKEICSLIAGEEGYTDAPYILIALASMMLTYTLGDIIYGQILLPMKREKYYFYSLTIGVILNISLSLLFGLVILKDRPAIGVAIATSIVDLAILIFLVAICWDYVKKAIFSINTLKLVIANGVIVVSSLLLTRWVPISNLWVDKVSSEESSIFTLLSVVLIDAIIYVASLLILKEDLVFSFIRKKPKEI